MVKTGPHQELWTEYNNEVAPALARLGVAAVNYVATVGSETRGNSPFTCSAGALHLRSLELARAVERLIELGGPN